MSGGDGYVAPLLRRERRGRGRLIVARSHGLEHRYCQAFNAEVSAGYQRARLRHRLYFGVMRLRQVELAVRNADLFYCHTNDDAEYAISRGLKQQRQVI